MNKIIALLVFALKLTISLGQNTSSEKNPAKSFDLICDSFNLSDKTKIGNLRDFSIDLRSYTLSRTFNSFWNKAIKLGGNSFTVDSIIHHGDTTYIEVSIYSLSEVELKANLDMYPRNKIYVLGDIDKRETNKTIKLNNNKFELKPLEYVSYQNKVAEEATISIGGLLGAKIWITGKEGRAPTYLSVNGFGVGGGTLNPVSISFNSGRIYPVDLNFGSFLVKVLPEKK